MRDSEIKTLSIMKGALSCRGTGWRFACGGLDRAGHLCCVEDKRLRHQS